MKYSKFNKDIFKTDFGKRVIEEIRPIAEKMYDEDIRALPYSKFCLFLETGSRTEYEEEYFYHKEMLCTFATMALADDNPKWFSKLIDVVWAICDTYSWAVPAHLKAHLTAEEHVERIELFASETAMALSEVYSLFEDKLPKKVKDRLVYELKRRIVFPYLKNKPHFGISNWSGVCGCGVGATMIYLDLHEEFEEAKPLLLENMNDFLESYPKDGCCLEGALYWEYGFSFFCFFADLLYEYTNGEYNLFDNEKVKKIAYFAQNICLGENDYVPFSDAPHTLKYSGSLRYLLSEKYDGIIVPDLKYERHHNDNMRFRFPVYMRDIFFHKDAETKEIKKDKRVIVYEDAQWYINKKNNYTFAAKAGHNDEPHNHNDVGSFLIYDNGKYIIDDMGWAEYTRDYFLPEKRYEYICTSSKGHSVPIPDKREQLFGKDKCGKTLCATDSVYEIEISGAYGYENLNLLNRRFELLNDSIILKDTPKGNLTSFTERFLSKIEPSQKDGKIYIDNYIIESENKGNITITPIEFEARFATFKNGKKSKCYAIDFEFDKLSDEYVFKITRK